MSRSNLLVAILVTTATLGLAPSASAHYNPTQGRWIERDPAGYVDGKSVYQYARSRPITALDPSGLKGGAAPVVPRHAPTYRPRPSRDAWPGGGHRGEPRPFWREPGIPLGEEPWKRGIPWEYWERPPVPLFPGIPDPYRAPQLEPVLPEHPDGGTFPGIYPTPAFDPRQYPTQRRSCNDDEEPFKRCFDVCGHLHGYHNKGEQDYSRKNVRRADELIPSGELFGRHKACDYLRRAIEYWKDGLRQRRHFMECMTQCMGKDMPSRWLDNHSQQLLGAITTYDAAIRKYYELNCDWIVRPTQPEVPSWGPR